MKHFTISMPIRFVFPPFFSWCTFLYIDAHCISVHFPFFSFSFLFICNFSLGGSCVLLSADHPVVGLVRTNGCVPHRLLPVEPYSQECV